MYCIVLYCIGWYCFVLHCIVFHCMVLCCIALCCIAWYCFVCIALYCIPLYCVVLYCIALYSRVITINYVKVIYRKVRVCYKYIYTDNSTWCIYLINKTHPLVWANPNFVNVQRPPVSRRKYSTIQHMIYHVIRQLNTATPKFKPPKSDFLNQFIIDSIVTCALLFVLCRFANK